MYLKRYPTTRPGSKAGDIKAVGRRGKFYQYTAIDDCTRLRIMKIYPQTPYEKLRQKTQAQSPG